MVTDFFEVVLLVDFDEVAFLVEVLFFESDFEVSDLVAVSFLVVEVDLLLVSDLVDFFEVLSLVFYDLVVLLFLLEVVFLFDETVVVTLLPFDLSV